MDYVIPIVQLAQENTLFRKELLTGKNSQIVLMCLQPKQDIGMEVHKVDQWLFVVAGAGEALLNGVRSPFGEGALIFVVAGTQHNIINIGDTFLKLYTVYAPPQHAPGTVNKTKADAERFERLHPD